MASGGDPFYISYPGGSIVESIEVGGEGSEVLADVDAAGRVVGIELVDASIPESVELARRFAAERGLEFPPNIVPPA
ncbi:MAG: hypothetical protein QOD51_3119 [Candidatus Eremiobacteraeota bacterium]|jgi:uncharacterized protein YuzE|nr:hypothetical protein [Candidatus Eremiobacteraeota bacterium]